MGGVETLVERGVKVFRDEGWVAFVKKLYHKLIYDKREFVWLELPLSDFVTGRSVCESELRIELVSHENFEAKFAAYPEIFDANLKPKLNADSILFVGILKDEIVGVARARIRGSFRSTLLNRVVALAEGEALADWLYVLPRHRPRGFGKAISQHRQNWMKENGFRMMFAFNETRNAPARASYRIAGFRAVRIETARDILFYRHHSSVSLASNPVPLE